MHSVNIPEHLRFHKTKQLHTQKKDRTAARNSFPHRNKSMRQVCVMEIRGILGAQGCFLWGDWVLKRLCVRDHGASWKEWTVESVSSIFPSFLFAQWEWIRQWVCYSLREQLLDTHSWQKLTPQGHTTKNCCYPVFLTKLCWFLTADAVRHGPD